MRLPWVTCACIQAPSLPCSVRWTVPGVHALLIRLIFLSLRCTDLPLQRCACVHVCECVYAHACTAGSLGSVLYLVLNLSFPSSITQEVGLKDESGSFPFSWSMRTLNEKGQEWGPGEAREKPVSGQIRVQFLLCRAGMLVFQEGGDNVSHVVPSTLQQAHQ